MKATLEFNLLREQSDYKHAIFGHKYYSVLTEFDRHLKQMEKNDLPMTVDEIKGIFYEVLKEEGIDLSNEGL